jgi:tetratricopeptide (TPR) repeat protein
MAGMVLLAVSFDVRAQGGYGPFDYTNPKHVREKLRIVEAYHFNSDVENLRAGMTSEYVVHDLAYVLRTFPNHHRALSSMATLWQQYLRMGENPPGAKPVQTPRYWFERAARFAPHDGAVPLLYGIYLHKSGKFELAIKYYKQAEKILPGSSEVHYNLGLLYVKKKDYRLAKLHAKRAYALGYPLPGLRNKLISVGFWP